MASATRQNPLHGLWRTRIILPLCALLIAPPVAAQTRTDGSLARVFAAQNAARQELGLAPLAWNGHLADEARQWANHLAGTGSFAHGAGSGSGQGENLWKGTRGAYSPEEMAGAWISEKRYFRPGRFPDVSTTGDWKTVGHYSQIIWRQTNEVGCAIVSSSDSDILVCRYANPGNVIGQQPY
jgi:uncharacterized protein YkwD